MANTSGELQGFSQDNYGYLVYDLENKKIVKGHNINKEFIPSSVTKLFTTLFASEILGNEYAFSTTLLYNGNISEGILTGNLYLKGSSDPELSLDELLTLTEGLKSKGIKEVKGNFFYDESLFATRDMLDQEMPSDAFYNAGIGPLSFNSNTIFVLQRRDKDGKISSADLLPSLPGFESHIYNNNISYPYIRFKSSGNREIWEFPDKYLWDNRQQLPVKHPGLYTSLVFQKLCAIHGIKLTHPSKRKAESSIKTICIVKSKTLPAVIKNMLFSSNNITAELIYKTTSTEYRGKNDLNTGRLSDMENFYKTGFKGINWSNFRIVNASGLTPLNRATPAQTAAVLLFIEKSNKTDFRLENILPLSGWDGTMKSRLDQPEAAFRVYGKTGSIFYSAGLAGIFYAKSGKRYIYSIFINDMAEREEYDRKKVKSSDDINRGGSWSKKASSAIDNFIIKQLNEL